MRRSADFRPACRLDPLPGEEVPLSAALRPRPRLRRHLRRSTCPRLIDRTTTVFAVLCGEHVRRAGRGALLAGTSPRGGHKRRLWRRRPCSRGWAITIAHGWRHSARCGCGCDGRARKRSAKTAWWSGEPSNRGLGSPMRGATSQWARWRSRRGARLTSRETGVLAALGLASVSVHRQPRVAVISTGDEIIPPGTAMRPGLVYDSNGQILADAVRELGGNPSVRGIVADSLELLEETLAQALESCDVVLLLGRHQQGRRRSFLSRRGSAVRPGHRRPRGGLEAWQTDLPGRQRWKAGCDSARFPPRLRFSRFMNLWLPSSGDSPEFPPRLVPW